MPAFNVVRTIEIDAPASRVRDVISDFNTWPIWSPWLRMEPDSKLSFVGIAGELGHGYDWEGKKVGAGGMIMTALDANRLEADLTFLKPWKSKAAIVFDFESIGDNKTRVNWHMDSSLPFFMFFMVNKMKAFIGNDYDRGLRMLKDHIETGKIESNTSVEGIVHVPSVLYAGKQYASHMNDLSESMGKAFPEVAQTLSAANADINGAPFCLYNKMDIVKGDFEYIAALPVASSVSGDSGLICKERPTCQAYKVTHVGSYKHLGNAWATVMHDLQHFKHKLDKRNPAIEVYINDPETTPAAELITEIYLPIRA